MIPSPEHLIMGVVGLILWAVSCGVGFMLGYLLSREEFGTLLEQRDAYRAFLVRLGPEYPGRFAAWVAARDQESEDDA